MARLPNSPLQKVLSGEPEKLVVGTKELVEVVLDTLGLLEVGLWASTQEHLERLGAGGEGRGGGEG